jgi:tryptophan synthase alpha chain
VSRLQETFAAARAEGRAALIGYLPAGFPSVPDSVSLIAAMVENGVDIVEVGLPYSDPLIDGPVIQRAAEIALAGGATTGAVLDVVGGAATTGAPILVMSYWNPIEQYGPAAFAQHLAERGGVGVITPDLTVEEAAEWERATDSHGIDRVFLAAPVSPEERLAAVCRASSGFVYAASIMGVTGTRQSVSAGAEGLVARLRQHTNLPIAVGLGVSTAVQAAQVAGYADGVIVGSAFVRRVLEADHPAAAARGVAELAAELAAGVRGRPPN